MADYADTVAAEFRTDLAYKVGEREVARLTGVTGVEGGVSIPQSANITAGIGTGDELGNFFPGA